MQDNFSQETQTKMWNTQIAILELPEVNNNLKECT